MHISRSASIAGISSAAAAVLLAAGVYALVSARPPAHPARQVGASPPARRAPPGPLLSPFTGDPVRSLHRVLIVKIDNVIQARPPTGLTKADLVYLLPMEGGLSRIMAVFSSHFPPVIGPVRSSREEDIKLLRQFGRPAFAFSGAQPRLLPVVEHARIVDLYAGFAAGYFRDYNRAAPYNLYASTRQLLAQAKRASKARSIWFRFGPAPPGGKRVRAYRVSYPAASFAFRWSAAQHRWKVWMDGLPAAAAEGGQLGGRTVVIQYTRIGSSGFLELGIRPPYASTVGSGRAVVLRNGRAYQAHWSRPSAEGGTSFTMANGRPMPFARGQVWVVLAAGHGSTWR
jgi:Protein of unknown function (DUF3048) N-terminal domain/Protein of unknown function (DUF3048) C-terminal domain